MTRAARPLLVLALALVLVLAPAGSARAQDASADLRLRVLALYDSTEDALPERTPIGSYLEAPANHLGLRLVYHDIAAGLPPDDLAASCRGIVTWFRDADMAGGEAYLRWLARQLDRGLRALVLENLGAERDPVLWERVPPTATAAALAALGLERRPLFTANPLLIEVVSKTAAVVEHERRLDGEVGSFDGYRALDPDARVYLALRRSDRPEATCHAVVVTRRGAFVAPGYAVWYEPEASRRTQWRVDPYRILSEAFALDGLPRPDPTTLLGSRILYSQVDGDGFESPSLAAPGRLCAEVLRDEVLARHGLPTAVGLIAAPLDPQGLGGDAARLRALAREVFALRNVEAASHTYTHPFDWAERTTAYAVPGYACDPVAEVERSVALLDRLVCPPGRPVRLVLWSGDCTPPPEAIAAAERLGLANLNGGETRVDGAFPSRTGLRPFSRRPGGRLQVHASMANENVYTRGWTGPFDGYRHVIETWERTGEPRRTHPVDLFYHFYAAERREGLEALRHALRWIEAHRDELIPIFASEYCAVVAGFDEARVRSLPGGGFEVSDYGALGTVRFDAEPRGVDLVRSSGVLGFDRRGDAVYVHLSPGGPARIYLGREAPDRPYIVRATVPLAVFAAAPDGPVRLRAGVARSGRVTVGGLGAGRAFRIREGEGAASRARADADGYLTVRLGGAGDVETRVEPELGE